MKTNQSQKNIPPDWQQVKLGDISVLNKKSISEKDGIEDFHYIDLSSVNAGILQKNESKISLNNAPSRAKRLFEKDDVLFANVRPNLLGHLYVNFDTKDFVCSTGFTVVSPKKEFLSGYFIYNYFFTKKFIDFIENITVGSSYPAINSSDLGKIKLLLPPLPEQNRIVSVLETWDKAIEKLSKKIEVKKQIKKGLMQDLLTGKKRLKGFSDEWKNAILDDVMTSFSTGLNPRDNFKLGFGKNYYVTIKNISNGHLDFSDAEMVDDIALKLINKRSKLSKNDIIMSSIGNVGESYLLQEDPKGWDINESVFCLKPNVKIINPKFLYFTIISSETRKYFENNITGSSFRSIKMKELKNMPIIIPEINEQNAIAEILTTADNEIQELEKKLQIIKDQKKYLLNNLITGTIRTPETLSTKLTK